ncbi:MAG: hypothetical protein U0414_15070 [Polyangiaceae bacterium]
MTPRRKRILRWALGLGLGLPLAFVGVVGFAHTKHGRFLLKYLPGMGACPLGYDQALTGEKLDATRDAALQPFKGSTKAAARPALGFTLGETTLADVNAWASAHGVTCKPDEGNALVPGRSTRCHDVPKSALVGAPGGVADLFLQFDSRDALVALRASRTGVSAEDAVSGFATRTADLSQAIGAPSATQGEADAAYLGLPLRQLSSTYAYSDYLAEVRATNVGSRIVYDESYQSIRD